jgi:uncharacterized protein (DUF2062 family)
MNPRRWLHEHSLKLLAIRDTPQAIAGGIAIGIFFGFTPLFGLKTLSAILFSWLTGSNILAAVLAGSLHDVIFWLMPAVYLWEYEVGFWLLSHPHHLPPASLLRENFSVHAWHTWSNFLLVGKPMLLGSLVCGGPISASIFFLARRLVARHQEKKKLQQPSDAVEPNPS